MQTDNWDRKLIIECVSKGINSILMQKPDVEIDRIKKIADFLTKLYIEKMEELKAMEGDPVIQTDNISSPESGKEGWRKNDIEALKKRYAEIAEKKKKFGDKWKDKEVESRYENKEELKTIPIIEE